MMEYKCYHHRNQPVCLQWNKRTIQSEFCYAFHTIYLHSIYIEIIIIPALFVQIHLACVHMQET